MDPPDPPTTDVPSTPRRRKWRRALFFAALSVILIAVLVVAFLPAILSAGLPGWINASLEGRVDATVELGAASFSWSGEQRIEGLRVVEHRPDGTARNILAVDRAVVTNSLLDLLGGSAPVTIEIEAPEIDAYRDTDGSLNWRRIARSEAPPTDASQPKEPPSPGERSPSRDQAGDGRGGPLAWPVARELVVKVRGGRFLYQDVPLATGAALQPCDLDLRLARETVSLDVSAQLVQLDSAGTKTAEAGELRLTGDVEGLAPSFYPEDVTAKATGVVSSVDLRPYAGLLQELAGLQAPAEPLDGRFALESRDGTHHVSIDLDAGFLALLGPLLPEGVETGEALQATISELSVRAAGKERKEKEAASPLETLQAEGRLELSGNMRYQGYRIDHLVSKFEVSSLRLLFHDVEASLNGGRLTAPRLDLDLTSEKPAYQIDLGLEGVEANYDMASLLAYLVPFLSLEARQGALSGNITAKVSLHGRGLGIEDLDTLEGKGEFRLRDGQFSGSRFFGEVARLVGTELDRVAFSELGSDFRISAGVITSDNVFLRERSDKLRNLGLKGTTTLDGELDYGVDLGSLGKTVGDRRIRDILEGVSAVLGENGVPVRLGGTLSAPRLTWSVEPGQKDTSSGGVGGLLDKLFKK